MNIIEMNYKNEFYKFDFGLILKLHESIYEIICLKLKIEKFIYEENSKINKLFMII